MLTNENAENYEFQIDSDDDYNAQENAENKDQSKKDSVAEILRHPAYLPNIEGPSILPEEAVNGRSIYWGMYTFFYDFLFLTSFFKIRKRFFASVTFFL